MKKLKKMFNSFTDTDWKSESFIALCILALIAVGYLVGSGSKSAEISVNVKLPEQAVSQTQTTVVNPVQTTQAPAQTETQPAPEAQTTAPQVDESTGATADSSAEETTEAASGEMSTAEIVAIFNESANKIKTDATKVVKNYEDREVIEDKLVVPSALQSLAPSLLDKFMTDDTEPVEYATREDIVASYMVPNQTYVSQLSEADVAEATCIDNGTEYEITIKLNAETNPTAGSGVGSVFDVIEASEVSDAVSFVKKFNTEYFDCVVKCKIDKASGHTTWSNYTTPLVLDVTVNMFGTHDASVGLSFEKDYTIYY